MPTTLRFEIKRWHSRAGSDRNRYSNPKTNSWQTKQYVAFSWYYFEPSDRRRFVNGERVEHNARYPVHIPPCSLVFNATTPLCYSPHSQRVLSCPVAQAYPWFARVILAFLPSRNQIWRCRAKSPWKYHGARNRSARLFSDTPDKVTREQFRCLGSRVKPRS